MIVSSNEIRAVFNAVWPGVRIFFRPGIEVVTISDPSWEPESDESLSSFLESAKIHELEYIPNVFACEEFSIALMNASRLRDAADFKAGKIKWNRPLGVVCGTRHDGKDEPHWWNIAITQTGARMIEPQTADIWIPNRLSDDPFFIFM